MRTPAVWLQFDASAFVAAMDAATRASARLFDQFRLQAAVEVDMHRDLDRAEQLVEVVRAGAWGRWYVRGALDPSYAEPGQRDLAVQQLTAQGRATEAGAFLAGWVSRGGGGSPAPLVWHRFLGATVVEVSAA
jgi:hypothetical protein